MLKWISAWEHMKARGLQLFDSKIHRVWPPASYPRPHTPPLLKYKRLLPTSLIICGTTDKGVSVRALICENMSYRLTTLCGLPVHAVSKCEYHIYVCKNIWRDRSICMYVYLDGCMDRLLDKFYVKRRLTKAYTKFKEKNRPVALKTKTNCSKKCRLLWLQRCLEDPVWMKASQRQVIKQE